MISDENNSETLQRDFGAVKDDLRKLSSDGGVLMRNACKSGRSSAVEAKAHFQDTIKAATEKGKKGLSAVRQQVGNRPGTALAAAFGVGLVLGLVLSSTRDRIA